MCSGSASRRGRVPSLPSSLLSALPVCTLPGLGHGYLPSDCAGLGARRAHVGVILFVQPSNGLAGSEPSVKRTHVPLCGRPSSQNNDLCPVTSPACLYSWGWGARSETAAIVRLLVGNRRQAGPPMKPRAGNRAVLSALLPWSAERQRGPGGTPCLKPLPVPDSVTPGGGPCLDSHRVPRPRLPHSVALLFLDSSSLRPQLFRGLYVGLCLIHLPPLGAKHMT